MLIILGATVVFVINWVQFLHVVQGDPIFIVGSWGP